MAKLFFIGDSITAGAWDNRGGWASRIMGQVMEMTETSTHKKSGFYCMSYNLGISGDAVPDLVRRIEAEIKARIYGQDDDDTVQLIFAVGVNDSLYSIEDNKNVYTDQEFKDDLTHLLKISRQFTDNITFIGLLPPDEDKVNPVPWLTGHAYTHDNVKYFDAMIKDFCVLENLNYIPLYDKVMALPDWQSYFDDGIHPNSKGHEFIANYLGNILLTPEFKKFHTK